MMNICKITILTILLVTTVFAQTDSEVKITKKDNTTIYETAGNLEITQKIGCLGFSNIKNTMTPADLYNGLAECIEKNDITKSAEIFAVAGAYAKFDSLRVADKSAHQANAVLTMQALQKANPEQKQQLMNELNMLLKAESSELKSSCDKIRSIGRPEYFPRYMIQHGMAAFSGTQANKGLVANFDPLASWEAALVQYLHCPGMEPKH